MYVDLDGERLFVATGGRPFDKHLPVVVFLHGSGMDHRCWGLQTRWFAFHGYTVLAPDLPGHSLSDGEPLTSIEAMSRWLWRLLDALEVSSCRLVGHSQGALVVLQAAADEPDRVESISLIATGAAIPVNPALLETARHDRSAAVDAMLQWGFGSDYQFGLSRVPGQSPIATTHRIMSRNPLEIDLAACDAYAGGESAADAITVPAQLILAAQDRMTPAKQGLRLSDRLANARAPAVLPDVGHMLPIEAPDACLMQLRHFIDGG